MSLSTPYWIGLGSSEQDEVELLERTVIMAITFYTIMAVVVYTLIFGLFYLFFCQPAQLLKDTYDDEPASKTKKRKGAKKIKKKKSAKRKPGPPGEGLDLDVTLDKTGKKAVKTNVVHPYIFGIRIPDCTVS